MEIIFSPSSPEIFQEIKLLKSKELGKLSTQISLKIKLFLGKTGKLYLIKSTNSSQIYCKIFNKNTSFIRGDSNIENIILKLKNIWTLRQTFTVNFSCFDDFYVGNLLINENFKGILVIKRVNLEFAELEEFLNEFLRVEFEEENFKG